MMSPKRRIEEANGHSHDDKQCVALGISEILDSHIADFNQWREDWERHREEAKIAMQRIGNFEPALKVIAENISHLRCLPDIQAEMKALNTGLAAQNASLIGQADKLITPGQKAQALVYNLLVIMVVMAGITLAVVLLRETGHGFKAGPFEMTPRQGASSNDAK